MLSERIKHLRLAKGLTLQQVGDSFGISAASVASWEKGKNQPDSRKLSQLAEVLGTSVEFLLNGANSSNQIDQELDAKHVRFISWVYLDKFPQVISDKNAVLPLHSVLSSSSFATRFPGSNDLNWTQGPIPAGALIFVDPEKELQTDNFVLIRLSKNQMELAKVQMPDKKSGFYLKLLVSGDTIQSQKEATVIGTVVEWRLSGKL